jgi:hypothetical protein
LGRVIPHSPKVIAMSTNLRINQRTCLCILLISALALVFLASPATAGWLPDGVPVCTAENFQGSLVTAPDGLGGAVMVWQDHRGGAFGIYAQRVAPNGNFWWTHNGVKLNGPSTQQFHPYICGDGAGGAWITWNDRDGGYGDIYLQHLDPSGNPDWAPVGGGTLRIGNAIVDNSLPVCTSDGHGGVVVAWVQEPYPPSGTYQIVAQRVSAAGTVVWPIGGVLVGNDIGAGEEISISPEAIALHHTHPGIYLGWRTSTGGGRVQWVDMHGAPRFNTIYGHSFGLTTPGSRVRVCHRNRGTSGAYVMYRWQGGLENYNHIFVASIDSTEYEWWEESVDSESIGYDVGNDYRVMDDGLNGVYCVWDRWIGSTGNGVYAKGFESNGDVDWGPRLVSDTEVGNHTPDATVRFGDWTILVSWVGDDGGTPRLKYSKVYRGVGGVTSDVLVPGGYSSYRPTIVTEVWATGEPIIAWMDERDPTDTDIYVTGLQSDGTPTHPNLVITDMYPESEPGLVGSGENSFFVMVKNVGTSQAFSQWTTIFPHQGSPPSAGDTPPPGVQSFLCPGLQPGDSLLVEIVIDAPASPVLWSMWGFADIQDDIEEFDDEDDNFYGPVYYQWLSLPNLEITQFTLTDYDPQLGDYVQAELMIENTGTVGTGPFDIDFYENPGGPPAAGVTGDQTFRWPGLVAGGAMLLTTAAFTNTGDLDTWQCYARVDTQEEIVESDETNNLAGPRNLKWDPPFHDGWPVAGGAGFYSSPAIAQLDDNPVTQEVVVGCDDGYLYAWDCDGNALPGWPVNVGDVVRSSPAVGDVTGDFHNEVVVGCQHGYIHVYDYQGVKLWTQNVGYPMDTTPALEDLNGDGKLEVIFAVGASTGGGYVDVLRGDGSQYPLLADMNLVGPGATSPAVGDVDDDGDFEIAVVNYGLTKPVGRSLVYLFTDDGFNYNVNWPAQIDTVVIAPPVLGDVTSAITGPMEVVVGGMDGAVYVLNLNGGVWPSPPNVGGPIETSPSLLQYDTDQYQEILVSTRAYVSVPPIGYYAGAVAAIDDDGTFLSKWPNSTATWLYAAALPSPVVTRNRILVGTPGRRVHGWINKTGSDAAECPVDVEMPMEAVLAVGDLDGDGFHDIVAATTGDSVYCYDMRTAPDYVASLDLEWPMYRNGRTRTGCYLYTVPSGIEDEADGDAPKVTALTSVYPNPFNPSTTVSFDVDERVAVTLAVFDVAGRRVAVLEDRVMEAGRHQATWDGTTVTGGMASSGVYFCRLVAGSTVDIKKMVLLK